MRCSEVRVVEIAVSRSVTRTPGASSALVQYFRYNPSIETVYRLAYSRQGWYDAIKEEIEAGRPLFYNITIHSLVCDGFRRDGSFLQYHVNYGWGGSNNAWFPIDEVPGLTDQWVEFMARRIVPAGRVRRVSADGHGAFPNLQAALTGALSEETIELEDGVYSGEGNRELIFPDKPCVLRSASGDPSKCVIDAGGTRAEPHVAISRLPQVAPGLTIEGITLRGAVERHAFQVAAEVERDAIVEGRSAVILDVGNPQCAVPVESLEFDWRAAGAAIEANPRFEVPVPWDFCAIT